MQQSPWWYRSRAVLFASFYVLGFLGGIALSRVAGQGTAPLFVSAGHALGSEGPRLLLGLATLLVAAGWAVRVWGSAYLSAQIVWNPDARTDTLLTAGPFAYVRNPLYLGSALIALGIAALATPFGTVLIVAGNLGLMQMLMRHETMLMRARYGAAYDAYTRAVPAFFPRFAPARIEGSPILPSFAQGMRAEILSACLFAGMIAVWVSGEYAAGIFTVLWVGGWIAQRIAARRAAAL